MKIENIVRFKHLIRFNINVIDIKYLIISD